MAARKTKTRRKAIPPPIQAQVLIESLRRRCLCYYLNGLTTEQLQGQLAHIDRDRTNCQESNLAYLCIPHHDAYDSIPRQSKRLTPAELRRAQQSLYDYLSARSRTEQVLLSITIDGDISSFTVEQQQHFLEALCLAAGINGGVHVKAVQRGSVRAIVTLSADDAARVCRVFNEGQLTQVKELDLPSQSGRALIVSGLYNEANTGIPEADARETVTSPDSVIFLDRDKAVSYDRARVGLYVKRYSLRRARYAVIVITAIDDHLNCHLYAALKADQRHVRVPLEPVQALQKFLDVFGVDITLPGLGTSRLFLGGQMQLPLNIQRESEALAYLTRIVNAQWREPFSMISNTRFSELGPFLHVYILAFVAQRRYLRAIRS